jgi:DNA invertase Pin-like site-specific DNA recombinase
MPEPTVQAAIYSRMSLAIMGDLTKVEDQERISREVCGHRGWDVAAVYCDNNQSAWQRDRKRPDWDRMLADVEAGKVGAIVVYHGDRLIRQPYDLEILLRLADTKGIRLASPTGTRDLDNPDDRFVLRIEAAQACRESDNTSRRKKNQHDRMRRAGLVRTGGRGGRAYGFAKDGVTQMPEEVKAIREMARRVLDGEGTGSIAASLNDRGLVTVTRGPWSHATIRKMLARPRYAGLMPDGEHKAAWEPVLGRDTWETVCAMLHTRSAGFSYATNARRYLLTGIALCGTCGHPLAIRHSTRSESLRGYGCINPECKRKLHRSVHHLDLYAEGWILEWLSSPELAELVAKVPEPVAAAEIVALEKRKAEAEAALENLADHPGLSLERAARAIASFDAKIAAVRERIAASPGRRMMRKHQGLTLEEWQSLPLPMRRGLISAACYVTILPCRRRGPGFDLDSVDIRPRE